MPLMDQQFIEHFAPSDFFHTEKPRESSHSNVSVRNSAVRTAAFESNPPPSEEAGSIAEPRPLHLQPRVGPGGGSTRLLSLGDLAGQTEKQAADVSRVRMREAPEYGEE